MILDQKVTIQAPIDKVWAFVDDMAKVSQCVPGVDSFEVLDANTYLEIGRAHV